MTEFRLGMRNLPYQVMVLKDIAREVLSARNYSELLKYRLKIRQLKNPDCRAEDDCSGGCDWWSKQLIMRPSNPENLLAERVIYVWIHEMSHFVWHKDKRKNGKRSRIHAKAFKNIEKRLWDKYKKEIKPRLPEMIEESRRKEADFRKIKRERKVTSEQKKSEKNTVEYKLGKVLDLKRKWKTKEKRANTALKKLNRKEKLYNTLLKKR